MWEVRHAERSSAAPAAVWALWSDPERWPDWNEDIERAELEGPFEVGTAVRIKFRRGGTIQFSITELEPERVFTDEARLPGATMGHEHRISPADGTIEISNRIYVRGPIAGLYRLLMGRRVRASVPGFVQRERELAEGASPPRRRSEPRRGSRRRRR